MSLRITILIAILSGLCGGFLSCRTPNDSAHIASDDANWTKLAWMNKAARALLYGSAGLSNTEADQLMPLSKDEIVDKLMNDSRFYDTVLDFNLFFLGLKPERLRKYSDEYGQEIFSERGAAVAALELSRQGDYFSIFDWKQPYVVTTRLPEPDSPDGQPDLDTPEKKREYFLDKAKESLDAWIVEVQGSTDVRVLCGRYLNNNGEGDYADYLDSAGLPQDLIRPFRKKPLNFLNCGELGGQLADLASVKLALSGEAEIVRGSLPRLSAIVGSLRSEIKVLTDLNTVSVDSLPILHGGDDLEPFSTEFWSNLSNSSTNYNRKRAAYMLKTFFCDDLTPLNIAAPTEHVENKHASDPACQACHYKLDPMGGFFRNRGIVGVNFDSLPVLIHDDQYQRQGTDLTKYLDSWKAPAGSPRIWNVGYIRSAKKESLNSYGEKLDDLFKIVREAPETKICLTKRMTEYILGIDQVYDGRWVQSLAKAFIDAAKPTAASGDSSVAFKKVAKNLVLSATFSTPDPVKGKCYDLAPGATDTGLPCEVSYIIEKNCTSCHGNGGGPKGLELGNWTTFPDGKSGFVHIDDASGQQLAPAVSLGRIACALSPTDQCGPVPLMPFNKEMDTVERATLYKWVQKELAGGA
jgi:hypothetical protein